MTKNLLFQRTEMLWFCDELEKSPGVHDDVCKHAWNYGSQKLWTARLFTKGWTALADFWSINSRSRKKQGFGWVFDVGREHNLFWWKKCSTCVSKQRSFLWWEWESYFHKHPKFIELLSLWLPSTGGTNKIDAMKCFIGLHKLDPQRIPILQVNQINPRGVFHRDAGDLFFQGWRLYVQWASLGRPHIKPQNNS